MSSCSKDHVKTILPQWLGALSQELRLVVYEITALGDQLSGALLAERKQEISALQSFDLLVQKATALADLMAGLERDSADSLDQLIAKIPFQEIRERLSRVARWQVPPDPHLANRSSGETEWF